MRELCEEHGLAVAADGKCVLCRRPPAGVFLQPVQEESLTSRITTFVLLGGLIAAVGALIYLLTLSQPYSGPRRAARQLEEAQSLASAGDEQEPGAPAQAPLGPDAGSGGLTTPDAAAAEPPAPTPAARTTDLNTMTPAQREALKVARRTVPVKLYTAPWCTLCQQAADYLWLRGSPVELVDVDADPAADKRLSKINPSKTLPTFEVAGEVLRGFNPSELERVIDEAVRAQR